jgi:hypothetical protein
MLYTDKWSDITREILLRGPSETWDGITLSYKDVTIVFNFQCVNGSYAYSGEVMKDKQHLFYKEEGSVTDLKKSLRKEFRKLKKDLK